MQLSPVVAVLLSLLQVLAVHAGRSPWSGRTLLNAFQNLHGNCPQGPQQENTKETMLNHHDWWEKHWGRSDDKWPRRGFKECWENRGNVCALPNQDHVVCLPGSRRGSTVSRGWALDPKSQACKPGVHCLYACEPGYYWTTFNQGETSNFDFANGHKRGNCDGSWDYGTSSHGVYCKEDGTLAMPSQPLCKMGETFVYAENRLDQHVFLCMTVFPGHEIFLIPTLVKAGETVMITTQPMNGWHGPTWNKAPHGDIYVSFAGADIMEACTWDEFSPSGAALLPYEIGTGVEDNGQIYSTHYFYQQPNSEVPSNMVGYIMDLECESTVDGLCGERVHHNNVITMVTRKKPPPGSTKVKFVFKKPHMAKGHDYTYREPNKNHMPDAMMITGLKSNMNKHHGGHHPAPKPPVTPAPAAPKPQAPTTPAPSSAKANYYPVPSPAYGGYGYHYPAVDYNHHYRRKLRSARRTIAFIENMLTEPIVACGSENGVRTPGMSVGPGEIVQLPEDGTFLVGLKGDAWIACSDRSKLTWMIDLDAKSRSYSYQPHPEIGLFDGHLAYGLQLKCVSDDDVCVPEGVSRVALSSEQEGDAEIFFRVKALSNSRTAEMAPSQAYAWGDGLSRFISSFFGTSSAAA